MGRYTIHAGHAKQGNRFSGAVGFCAESVVDRQIVQAVIKYLRLDGNDVFDCTVDSGISQGNIISKIKKNINSYNNVIANISIHLNAVGKSKADGKVKGCECLVYSILNRDAVMGKRILTPDVYSWGITTLLIFSSVGVILGHITTKSRFERYVYLDSAEKLAEIQKNYNKELQKEVAAKTERIVTLHDHFVIGMATMVESRDNSTGGHIRRTSMGVKILMEEIRKGIQLSDTFCEKIIKAAPMHDLGKI